MTHQRILVTGGAGFLGFHLCQHLLGQGHEVISADNYSTGSRANIAALAAHNPRLKVIQHDVIEPLEIEVEQIYNLACPASPIHYQRDAIQTLKTCVYGAANMLELARNTRARVFQASTSEVYGDPKVHPQPESYWGHVNPNGTRACYDEGKRAAEALFYDYHRQHGVAVRVARIFNTYGPQMRADDGRVVSNFIVQALRGDDLTIYGDGSQTRSFCFVSDLILGIVALMQSDEVVPVNLGNPGCFTVLELAQMVQRLLPESTSKIVHRPLPQDDPQQRQPDITLAQSALAWSPTVDLEEGLARTIAYFKAQQ